MTTTLNKSYLSKPITVGEGGTSLTTATTAYGLIVAGTTATGAFQNAGAGTSGQVYVSGGSSALGTWTAQNAVGCWTVISTLTASSSATIAFTGLTTSYIAYKISISAVVPGTTASSLIMQVSSNNGSSYDNSSGNYGYVNTTLGDTGTATFAHAATGNATGIHIGNAMSSTGLASNYDIMFIDPATSSTDNGIFWMGKYNNSSTNSNFCFGEGSRLAAQVNNAIQFSFTAGNIASGVFKLYGLAK